MQQLHSFGVFILNEERVEFGLGTLRLNSAHKLGRINEYAHLKKMTNRKVRFLPPTIRKMVQLRFS